MFKRWQVDHTVSLKSPFVVNWLQFNSQLDRLTASRVHRKTIHVQQAQQHRGRRPAHGHINDHSILLSQVEVLLVVNLLLSHIEIVLVPEYAESGKSSLRVVIHDALLTESERQHRKHTCSPQNQLCCTRCHSPSASRELPLRTPGACGSGMPALLEAPAIIIRSLGTATIASTS